MEIQIKETNLSITNDHIVGNIFRDILRNESVIDQDKEHFWVMGLNQRNTIKYIELVSLGTLTSSLVHPRETFRMAILKGVAGIIAIHNHPSGDPSPSEDDLTLTVRLKEAGKIIGINLLDHIIIAGPKQRSFKNEGLL
jgi:DNA repair protein RadC